MERCPPVPLGVFWSEPLVLGDVPVVHQPGVDGGDVTQRDEAVTDPQDAVHDARRVHGEGEVDLRAAALAEDEDVGAEVTQRVEDRKSVV